jgi:hypothetical protein
MTWRTASIAFVIVSDVAVLTMIQSTAPCGFVKWCSGEF